ncbi:ATP-binding protein [Thermodesulfobacteriota bacterium]
MKTPARSLRIGILTHLGFLILSALLLMNVVMVKFAERDLLLSRLKAGDILLNVIEKKVQDEMLTYGYESGNILKNNNLSIEISLLVHVGGFSKFLIVNRKGLTISTSKSWGEHLNHAIINCRNVMTTGKEEFNFYGTGWGVIWLAHKKVLMSAPIKAGKRTIGAITIGGDLDPIYKALRDSERTALIYIALNTLVLVVFGIYLLSRSVIKPIHKLISITDKFEAGEPFPSLGENQGNEIGQLSLSLNLMLKRLEENKQELKEHISTLENANLELKKAQMEIVKSEKLASVGRLATGVAHEIGNPVGIILGYLELLRAEGLSQEEKNDFLDRIESEVTRVSKIIKQLLDFSRPASKRPEPTHAHDVLRETVEMLKPQPMMSHMEIVEDLKSSEDEILVDPDQLKQVFLNIILNASDAMKEGSHGENEKSEKTLTIRSEKVGGLLEISFEDTGPGIPDEVIPQIFDPFYTTKEPGMGTGLGLSVSYRIIETLGGTIKAKSEPGKGGATIIIDIPLIEGKNTG